MEAPFAKHIRRKIHWIEFESEGKILRQSPGMAAFANRPTSSLLETYPLLESMILTLDELPEETEVVLPCVQTELGGKMGWFDFVFKVMKKAERHRYCVFVMDLTEQYFRLFTMQQSMNQTAIDLQMTQRELEPKIGSRASDGLGPQPHLASVLSRIHTQNSIILDRLQSFLQRGSATDEHPYA